MASRRNAPTLEDVARAAGVSRATASRVVRGGHLVRSSTRKTIEAAIKELGYVPNQAARSLATSRSSTIAVIVSEDHTRVFKDPFFATSVAGVAERLEPTGWQMALYLAYGEYRQKLEQYLRGGYVDAILVVSHHDDDQLADLLEDIALPCAFLGRPAHDESAGRAFSVAHRFVDLDNLSGGRIAGRHLVERGCRRIATITGPMDIASARERLMGFEEALAEVGLQPVGVYHGNFEPESARQQAMTLCDEGNDFDGLFVASDHMAAAAMTVLTERGLTIPDDVKVIGFDDADISRETEPALSTVMNPWRDLAIVATDMVLSELEGEPSDGPVILQPELVARRSTE